MDWIIQEDNCVFNRPKLTPVVTSFAYANQPSLEIGARVIVLEAECRSEVDVGRRLLSALQVEGLKAAKLNAPRELR